MRLLTSRNYKGLILCIFLALALIFHGELSAEKAEEISEILKLDTPKVIVSGIPSSLTVQTTSLPSCDSLDYHCTVSYSESGDVLDEFTGFIHSNERITLKLDKSIEPSKVAIVLSSSDGTIVGKELRVIPGFSTILPPLVAIMFALLFKEVVVSLTLGVWLGAFLLFDYSPFKALLGVVDYFAVEVLTDRDHIAIVVFTLLLGGLVGVVSKSGGTKGIVDSISRYANSARRGQIATWLIGLLVFFDDYANCLIVGNTMRPISDKLKISREKLAYIVDATAAPVSSIALISTWIGFEVGLIGDGLSKYGIDGDPYLIFLQTIPYRFYPILSLIMIVFVVGLNRDVGSMLHAEKRARVRGEVLRPGSVPTADTESEALIPKHGSVVRWQNAAIPIIFLVVGTFAGLYMDGLSNMSESTTGLIEKASINEILAYADSFKVLLWTSFLGTILAITLAASQRILSLRECLNSMISGMRSMMTAMIILVLAWSIGTVCKELETAHYIVEICSGIITPSLLPFLTFVMAALISFATGSSWATMAILIPIIIPIAHEINTAGAIAQEGSTHTLVTSLSSILAGAVFGDHCSPISDTTIMSSMSAGVDHIDHVRTQLPYALTVALVGVLVGDIPSGFGVNPWISLTVGSFVLFLVVRFLWKPLPASEDR